MPSTPQLGLSAAPREARAPTPTNWPTTAVSTTVYSCWNTLPTISGRAKVKISRVGEPSVILRIRCAIKRPLSLFCACFQAKKVRRRQRLGFPGLRLRRPSPGDSPARYLTTSHNGLQSQFGLTGKNRYFSPFSQPVLSAAFPTGKALHAPKNSRSTGHGVWQPSGPPQSSGHGRPGTVYSRFSPRQAAKFSSVMERGTKSSSFPWRNSTGSRVARRACASVRPLEADPARSRASPSSRYSSGKGGRR